MFKVLNKYLNTFFNGRNIWILKSMFCPGALTPRCFHTSDLFALAQISLPSPHLSVPSPLILSPPHPQPPHQSPVLDDSAWGQIGGVESTPL